MNKTYSLDGVQNILSYPFKQVGWQSKFVIGTVLFFANYVVPIVPSIFMTGYYAKIMQAAIEGETEPALPEWDNWGDLFSRGWKVTCATLVYILPSILMMVAGYLLMYIPMIIASLNDYSSSSTVVGSLIGVFVGMGLFLLGCILSIPLGLLLPPAIAHCVAKNSFAAAFQIREWWAIFRANFWGFFTALAVSYGVYMMLLMAVYIFYFTIILCFLMPIGLGVIVFYLSVVGAPMLGEAYRKGVDTLATADGV